MKTTLLLILLSSAVHADDWLQPIRDANTINEARERLERQDERAAPCPEGLTFSEKDFSEMISRVQKNQQKKDRASMSCLGPFCFKLEVWGE